MIDDLNKIIQNDKILLHKPNADELKYRKVLHKDQNGVSKTPEQLEAWYLRFNHSLRNYYAYIVSKNSRCFVGDISVYYDFDQGRYMIDVLIQEEHKYQGYAQEAIELLIDYVFNVMNLDAIYEKGLTEYQQIFKQVGFEPVDKEYKILTKKHYNGLMKARSLN